MVRIEGVAPPPGGDSKQSGHSTSPDTDLVPIQIPRRALLVSMQNVQNPLPRSSPNDAPLVQIFIQRQAPPKPSGNPWPQQFRQHSTEASHLTAVQIPLQVLRESLQDLQAPSVERSPHDSDFVQVLVSRHVLLEFTQNNQPPPPEIAHTQEAIRAFKVWWTIFVATVLAGGNDLIMLVQRSMKSLPAFLLVLLALPTTINLILPPMCNFALVANHLSYCAQNYYDTNFAPDFPRLASLQNRLENAMDESASGAIVAVDLKRSELAVRDLKTLLEHSTLSFKVSLAKNLGKFITDAKSAGRDLQRFSSRVGGTVDEIVALNEHVLQLLERTANEVQPQIGEGRVERVINSLIPAKPIQPEVIAARRKEIKTLWFHMTSLMKVNIEKLIFEAQRNTRALDELEEQLNLISGIIVREDNQISADEMEMLDRLWTRLGGNKEKLRHLKSHGLLLKEVRKYREDASAHVARTLFQLQQMSTDLEDLDERVSSPALLGEESGIPLEVHIGAMKLGTGRLLEGRKLAREREDKYLRKMIGSD